MSSVVPSRSRHEAHASAIGRTRRRTCPMICWRSSADSHLHAYKDCRHSRTSGSSGPATRIVNAFADSQTLLYVQSALVRWCSMPRHCGRSGKGLESSRICGHDDRGIRGRLLLEIGSRCDRASPLDTSVCCCSLIESCTRCASLESKPCELPFYRSANSRQLIPLLQSSDTKQQRPGACTRSPIDSCISSLGLRGARMLVLVADSDALPVLLSERSQGKC